MDVDSLRLITKVARTYHERGLRQAEIAGRLRLSQPRVSRLLAQAEELGIVRNIVDVPSGLHDDLERDLCRTFGLTAAHVVDAVGGDDELATDLGHAAASLLPPALAAAPAVPHTVGFTSWSRTLRHMVEAMRPTRPLGGHVVEMIGDVGAPTLQQDVAYVTQRLATLTGTRPVFLRVPGVVPGPAIREALLRQDPHAREAVRLLDDLDVALLGVGPCEVVAPLAPGDNYFTDEQFAQARQAGAVGQICLRFLDPDGIPVSTPLDELIVGVTPEQLRRARDRWVVAGGVDKRPILRAALRGNWVDRLVTDAVTADHLVQKGA